MVARLKNRIKGTDLASGRMVVPAAMVVAVTFSVPALRREAEFYRVVAF